MDEAFLNLLKCSACRQQLDGTSKFLPCQHTFCEGCLHTILDSQKELRCPECQLLVDVKIEELPCNILLVRILGYIKNNALPKEIDSCSYVASKTAEIDSCTNVASKTADSPSSTSQQQPLPQSHLLQPMGCIPRLPSATNLKMVTKQIMLPKLTSGSIAGILNGIDVSGAVMQILTCKKFPDTGDDRYRLLISDGLISCPFAMLGVHLNCLVTDKVLDKFCIVRVDKYICNQTQQEPKIIIFLNITVLTLGADVGKKIGNPVFLTTTTITTGESATATTNGTATATTDGTETATTNETATAPTNETAIDITNETAIQTSDTTILNSACFNTFTDLERLPFTQANGSPQSVHLTSGAITQILNGDNVSGAVIQILNCKKIPGSAIDRYRLLISDGITSCPFAVLGIQLKSLVTNNELEKFTIVRVNKYACNQVQPDRKVIILLNLTVLTPGAYVGETIGNPVFS